MYRNEGALLLSRHWKFLCGVSVGAMTAAVLLSVLIAPLEYRAQARLLITPQIAPSGVIYDEYTALKSAEQIGETLSNVIRTTVFQDKVLASPGGSILQPVATDTRTRREQWFKQVDPLVLKGTGIVTISTFDTDSARAEKIAQVVSETIITEAQNYIPGKVAIRIVDPALATRYPVRPNLPLRALFGFILGGLFAGLYLYITDQPRDHYFGI